jgi:hypothetical protein
MISSSASGHGNLSGITVSIAKEFTSSEMGRIEISASDNVTAVEFRNN